MKELIALIVTAIFSGSVPWIFFFKSKQKKAIAEAKGSELDNIDTAITIWRKLFEESRKELQIKQELLEKTQLEHSKKIKKFEEKICLVVDCKNRVK